MGMFAKAAFGMQLYVGGTQPADPFVRVMGVQELDPPAEINFSTKEIVEHKINTDPGAGFADKLAIPVTSLEAVSVKLTWIADDAGQIALKGTEDDTRNSIPHYYKILRRDGGGWTFAGYLTKWALKTGLKDEITVDGQIEIVGGVTEVEVPV